jgi:flavin reductase (DIM6/NTAB) family NADH-FMN oxidoreductase RutF/rubredoxin
MQITSSPATVAVSINHDNYTNECIQKHGYFSVCVLSERTDPKLIGKFGFFSGRETDKFKGFPYHERGEGEKLPIPDDCCAYLTCMLVNIMETPTHSVLLGEVLDGDVIKDEPPMTYAYYHDVVKGKTAKNAPTYQQAKPNEKASEAPQPARKNTIYVCSICGHVYEGDVPFEELPDDWVCPVCGVGKDKFVKQ